MDEYTYSPRTLANLAAAVDGLQSELLNRGGMKLNPRGGESYVDLLGSRRAAEVRADQMFPHRSAGDATEYKDAFMFTKTRKKFVPAGVDKNGRNYKAHSRSVNSGLIMAWGGPVPEKQTDYGPTLSIRVDGVPTTVSWAGLGWKMLKRLANVEPPFTGTIRRGSRTIEGTYLPCQDLTPWAPSNPDGTGIWNVAAKRIIDGQVRKDEKFVAAGMMELIGNELMRLVIEAETSGHAGLSQARLREAKGRIANFLDAALLCLFGTVDPFEIDKIHEEGKKYIEEFAAEKAAERAASPAKKGGAPMSGLAALGALGRR